MRTLVISQPGPTPAPPEAFVGLLEAFKGWRDRWRSKMEIFEFFADGNGGWAVVNTTDEVELSQLMMEYPLAPFSVISSHLTIDGDEAMSRLMETAGQMIAAMRQG